MTRYRIVEKTNKLNEKTYYIQQKFLCFWCYMCLPKMDNYLRYSFGTKEMAEEKIKTLIYNSKYCDQKITNIYNV